MFKSDAVLRLNHGAIRRKLLPKVAVEFVNSAQRIVADAARNHPYTDQTGNNTRRIGWAGSGPEQRGFGPLTTNQAGTTSTAGSGKTSKPGDIDVMVATSSGYGGYLEVGTRRMKKKTGPYIYPAAEREKPKRERALTKIV